MKSREYLRERILSYDRNYYIPKQYSFQKLINKLASGEIRTRQEFDSVYTKLITGTSLVLSRKSAKIEHLFTDSTNKMYQTLLDYFLIHKNIFVDDDLSEIDLSGIESLTGTGFGLVSNGVLFSVGLNKNKIYIRPIVRQGLSIKYRLFMRVNDATDVEVFTSFDCGNKCPRANDDELDCSGCEHYKVSDLPEIDDVVKAVKLIITALLKGVSIKELDDIDLCDTDFSCIVKSEQEKPKEYDRGRLEKIFSEFNFTSRQYNYSDTVDFIR